MPKYTDPQLTMMYTKGYMDFIKYQRFKEIYNSIQTGVHVQRDKMLFAFIYFTGARPGEILEIKREDVQLDSTKLVFRVPTLKLSKNKPEPRRTIRFVEWPNYSQFSELHDLWAAIQPLPNGMYVFGWLKMYNNPRDYIKHHIGSCAYVFRHNLMSLFLLAGGSQEQAEDLKGGGSIRSYQHLSKEKMQERGRILTKAIKG